MKMSEYYKITDKRASEIVDAIGDLVSNHKMELESLLEFLDLKYKGNEQEFACLFLGFLLGFMHPSKDNFLD